jgi:two-component system sensor histidine kinase BaeS
MLSTLRRRFVLSHVLPLLVIVPIMGIALIYVLETQLLQPRLVDELKVNAGLIAEITRDNPGVWHDPAQARTILTRIDQGIDARVMLLDSSGHLLASDYPADADRQGQMIDDPGLATVLAGQVSVHTDYSAHLHAQVADVMVPVVGANGQILGVVRLDYPLTSVLAQFLHLRYITVGVLMAGLLLGSAIGWLLAGELARALGRVTRDIYRLAGGRELVSLRPPGIKEIDLLLGAFNTLVERLESGEEARRLLLAALVHELGRPLGAVQSAIQALQGGASQDAATDRELLEGMAGELRRLGRLLDDLSLLRDRVVGGLQLDVRPTRPGEWLSELLVPWREAARAKGLDWKAAIAPGLPELEIDPDRVGQALGNVLSNAIKYTPPGGRVSVSSGMAGDKFWVQVSDTGPGISAEDQKRIFTPFFRGQATRGANHGTGLGLSIARELMVAHNGQLEVSSTPGQGSQFTLWLPCSASASAECADEEEGASTSGSPSGMPLGRRRVGTARTNVAHMSLLRSSSPTSMLFNPASASNYHPDEGHMDLMPNKRGSQTYEP